ncbi:MAG: hypothetical protein Kow00127_21360 [Bacteroidales bacterium]
MTNLKLCDMKTKKILIVDDDVDIINILSTLLENEGYEVVSANGKAEAIELARKENPDLAILDVMMSTHFEGFELAEEMSKDEQLTNIPVLMQTSIEVFTTTRESVREMAREFRNDPRYSELQVILLKDIVTGKAGIDYRSEDGRTVWLPVGGFLKKPVQAADLLNEVKRLTEAPVMQE